MSSRAQSDTPAHPAPAQAGGAELKDHDDTPVFLFFKMGGKRYGFSTNAVLEVLPMLEPIPVPHWSSHRIGLIDIRGELIPLVDLAELLGMGPSSISPSQFIIIMLIDGKKRGVLVDSVEGIHRGTLRASPELSGDSEMPNHCLGIAGNELGPVIVLDPAKALMAEGDEP